MRGGRKSSSLLQTVERSEEIWNSTWFGLSKLFSLQQLKQFWVYSQAVLLYAKGWQMFSVMSQRVNIPSFVGQTTQFCCWSSLRQYTMNKYGWVPIKLYLQKQAAGHIWSEGCCSPIPILCLCICCSFHLECTSFFTSCSNSIHHLRPSLDLTPSHFDTSTWNRKISSCLSGLWTYFC